jgi:tRNA pseudouridine38-40 synthase
MIEIGAERLSLSDFEQIIVSKNRNFAGRAVPPEGLTLVEVGYKF